MEHIHTISHIEIPAPNFTAAVEFYSEVFKWGVELVAVDHYAFFTIGNTGKGGSLDASLMAAHEKTGPQLVIDVNDIEETLKQIELKGGRRVTEKTEIPGGHGFYAVFKDPNDNYMQIHARQ